MIRSRHSFTFLALLACATALATLTQCGGGEPPGKAAAAAPVAAPNQVAGERVRLLLSGSMLGRLEPCGCASGQLGGLGRRMALIQETPVYDLLIEGGDLVEGHTRLDLEKAITAVSILFGMRKTYDVLAVGPQDLELPLADWSSLLASYMTSGNNGPDKHALVASDLRSTAGGWPGQPFFDKDVRGTTVRVAALVMRLPDALKNGKPAPFELLSPEAAWQRAMAGARPETRRIVLVHADPGRVREVAAALRPAPDLVVGIDAAFHEPPNSAETAGGVPVVFPGIRGRVLLDVTLARTKDGAQITEYQPIELRGSETKPSAGQDPDVKLVLLQHREFVKEEKVLEAMANHDAPADGRTYVGTEACKSCHEQEYQAWTTSKHSRAWQTLVDAENDGGRKYGWPVTHYPDCVSCHVVGYREPGGFVSGAATPQLVNVGCERCHGPGSRHVATSGTDKLGKVGGGAPSMVCTQCHDFEQSPNFDYSQHWMAIQHGQKYRK